MSETVDYFSCKAPGSEARHPASLVRFARPLRTLTGTIDGLWASETNTTLVLRAHKEKISGTLSFHFGEKHTLGELTGYVAEHFVAFTVYWADYAALCSANGHLAIEDDVPALYVAWDLSIFPKGAIDPDSAIGTQRFRRTGTGQ